MPILFELALEQLPQKYYLAIPVPPYDMETPTSIIVQNFQI